MPRLFAEFKDKKEFKDQAYDILQKIPKKYHFDLAIFIGRLESTLMSGKELK
jgi:hypothetical protein